MANKSFDYIIVGGGSSGCVIANRLTENEAVNVLLLEAGGKDSHPYIHMPVGFSKLTAGPRTWGFNTVPQKFANNREIPYAQGKVLAVVLQSMPKFLPEVIQLITTDGQTKRALKVGHFRKYSSIF